MKTHKGMKRKNNEDYCSAIVDSRLSAFIIADGMGGHCAGEVASSLAVEKACELIKKESAGLCDESIPDFLKKTISDINTAVYERSLSDSGCIGMGTTIIIAVFYKGILYAGHVGDSRIYVISREGIDQISVDHSYVEELIKNRIITKDEARYHPRKNIITRAVGSLPSVNADILLYKMEEDDVFLMCTDGLTNMVNEEIILDIIRKKQNSCEICEELIKTANNNGGDDNITVVLIDP